MNFKKSLLASGHTAALAGRPGRCQDWRRRSLTGPGSGLGIPKAKAAHPLPRRPLPAKRWNSSFSMTLPIQEKRQPIARRFVTEDKVDVIFGSKPHRSSAAITPIAFEAKTAQVSGAPIAPQGDKESICSACHKVSR